MLLKIGGLLWKVEDCHVYIDCLVSVLQWKEEVEGYLTRSARVNWWIGCDARFVRD